ncbi:MAG: hypothetical protein ACTSVY_09760 [Candidatus Helarchaeota archaeon]
MHFINKIIHDKVDNSVHNRFVKFSKGTFNNGGPVLVIKASAGNKSWSFNSSYEYEDQIGVFYGNTAPEETYSVKGTIYTLPRVKLDEVPLFNDRNWTQGKRDLKALHFTELNEKLDLKEILKIYDELNPYCAILLNILPSQGKNWTFKTKDKIPSIKKLQDKNPLEECKEEKQNKCKFKVQCETTGVCVDKRIGFAKLKTGQLDDKAVKLFYELFIPDFKDIPSKFKELCLINSYQIDKIELPPNKDKLTPREMREKAKKIGKIKRLLWLDGKTFSTEISFSV